MITHYPKDWIKRASAHYIHACEKHPHFCHTLLPNDANEYSLGVWLQDCRNRLAACKRNNRFDALNILECEIAEAASEIGKRDGVRAIEEIYDAIAVLLRMADAVERGVK